MLFSCKLKTLSFYSKAPCSVFYICTYFGCPLRPSIIFYTQFIPENLVEGRQEAYLRQGNQDKEPVTQHAKQVDNISEQGNKDRDSRYRAHNFSDKETRTRNYRYMIF